MGGAFVGMISAMVDLVTDQLVIDAQVIVTQKVVRGALTCGKDLICVKYIVNEEKIVDNNWLTCNISIEAKEPFLIY